MIELTISYLYNNSYVIKIQCHLQYVEMINVVKLQECENKFLLICTSNRAVQEAYNPNEPI